MKKQSVLKTKALYFIPALIGILTAGIVFELNLDIFTRALHSYQNRTLTMEKFRLDLASYNLGQNIPPIPSNAKKSQEDGMIQVYVPEGEFIMGIGDNKYTPSHAVYLDAFWMDRVEVTNSMYLKCIKSGTCTPPASPNLLYDKWEYRDHPVVYITWFQAVEYCHWAGRRLPTEAEWEKAARGTDGRPYPWGFEDPNPRLANYEDTMIHEATSAFRYQLGASPYGVLNMSGNAREWVADWYDRNYYAVSPYKNPTGPITGKERTLRSGSYNEDHHEVAAYQRYRHEPQSAGLSRGFRCAQSANSDK